MEDTGKPIFQLTGFGLFLTISGYFRLCQTISDYFFTPEAVQWFRSYQSGRSQRVQVESKISTSIDLGDYSVPQGSILGPLVFIIFNNDFPDSTEEGESVLFADDDTDVVQDSDPNNLEEKIQREASRSTEWVKDNRMVCAGDKTKLLVIGTKQLRQSKIISQRKNIVVQVCGNRVETSHSEKLLGVIVNEELNWKEHLYGEQWRQEDNAPGLIPQLSKRVGLLTKLSNRLSPEGFNSVSNGLFYSKLGYCIHLFGNVWGYDTLDEKNRHFSAFTKEDKRY
mgnify:CR=1 FL=1